MRLAILILLNFFASFDVYNTNSIKKVCNKLGMATRLKGCVMIPLFEESGNLPPGIHWATWEEIERAFGINEHRIHLLRGLKAALHILQNAGCLTTYIDGSFVTSKEKPADFDCCWNIDEVSLELLDPTLMNFSDKQTEQKEKFGGELFPNLAEQDPELSILDWFQLDKNTGKAKGIVAIDLRNLQ